MINLKLGFLGEPYKYISEMRIIIDTFATLEIDINTVIQFFVWNGLNDQFKSIFTNITNEQNLIYKPSEIICLRPQRYLNTLKPIHIGQFDTKVENLALDLKYNSSYEKSSPTSRKFPPGFLCKADGKSSIEHPLFKCEVYGTNKTKLNKLRSIKGCLKCGNSNHETRECRYNFRRKCRNCNKYHFDYLCSQTTTKLGEGHSSHSSFNNDKSVSSSSITINLSQLKR